MRISKRLFKRIGIGFGLVIGVLLVINGILAWTVRHRLDQKIAELHAAGEPALLADLAPKPIEPKENAAVYLHEMAVESQKFNHEWDKVFLSTPLGKQLDRDEEKDLPPREEVNAAMRPILDAHSSIPSMLAKAASCERYASLLDFDLPSQQFLESLLKSVNSEPRPVASFVRSKMDLLIADGKWDDAIRTGVRMLRLVRFYDEEPGLISHLVALSMRGMVYSPINWAIRHNEVSAAVRAELDAELALHDSLRPLQDALSSDRAYALQLATEQAGGITGFMRWPFISWALGEVQAEDEGYRISKLPLDQIERRWDVTSHRMRFPQLESIRSRQISPAVGATFYADFRYLNFTRCLRLVNALGAYRDRTGKDAESVEQLALPREAIIDLWTGKPLRIRKTDAGWIVYSLYRNGEDDGGQYHSEDLPWGFGPPGYVAESSK
jgi:hypothetical protein